MPISNPWSITWAGREVGGTSRYQIHGVYRLSKSFEAIGVSFDVVVVGRDYDDLQHLCDDLETDFRKRDADFTIEISGTPWRYRFGYEALNSRATISKPGTFEVDRGVARLYRCSIDADLPADGAKRGLRDLSTNVQYAASRQKTVTFRGTYTGDNGSSAVDLYDSLFDAEAQTLLSAIGSSAVFELVDESTDENRTQHLCSFQRQYVELLADQAQGSRDHASIVDHRINFSNISQHPGDSRPDVYRLRRVVANYSCAADIENTTDLHSLLDNTIRPHIKELFRRDFSPKVFCVEEGNDSYDETSKRLSVTMQFLYQADGGNEILEIHQSLTYDEKRDPDYTHAHGQGETDAYVDPGFATITRVWERTVYALGSEAPGFRIAGSPAFKVAGAFGRAVEGAADTLGGGSVKQSGWNIIANRSGVEDMWCGDPNEDQLKMFILRELVIDRYTSRPSAYGGQGAGGAGGIGGSGGLGVGIGGTRGNTTFFGFGLPGADPSRVGVLGGRRAGGFGV